MNIRIDSFDNKDFLNTVQDFNQPELKKQSDQAKRFGNPALKDHPYLGHVKEALQSLQPEQLLSVLENTRHAIGGNGETVDLAQQQRPQLIKPEADKTTDTSITPAARLLALLGKISELTLENTLQNQATQLQSYNSMMSGMNIACGELAKKLVVDGNAWAHDHDALKRAQQIFQQLAREVKRAESDINNILSKLSLLEIKAKDKGADAESLNKIIKQLKEKLASAQAVLVKQVHACQQHENNVLKPALRTESISKAQLTKTLAQSQATTDSMNPAQQTHLENQRLQENHQSHSLTFLIALMSQLIDKTASDNINAAAELKQKLSEAAAKESEKKALEYEEGVRKSEELQKTMGCVGKTLGWIITTVSLAAAIFTGGASLAFAAVGLALTMGDEINQAVNGESFIAQALQPLIDGVVQPLIETLGQSFAAILESLGADKATAGMVGQILGAITAAVFLVAVAFLASNLATKMVGALSRKISSETMNKIFNKALTEQFKNISMGVGKTLGLHEVKVAQISTYTQMGLTGSALFNTVAQSAGNIIAGEMKLDAAKIKAKLLNSAALQDLLDVILTRLLEAFKKRINSSTSVIKNISSVADNQMQVGKYITQKMRVVAG